MSLVEVKHNGERLKFDPADVLSTPAVERTYYSRLAWGASITLAFRGAHILLSSDVGRTYYSRLAWGAHITLA